MVINCPRGTKGGGNKRQRLEIEEEGEGEGSKWGGGERMFVPEDKGLPLNREETDRASWANGGL
jgi:hypothetical protein